LAENLVIARRDRGINELSDLRGKKIGFSEGTSSDYLLHSYLIKENISLTEITAVNIPPEKQSESIVNGEVDAVFAFEVQASDAIERLGKNAVLWDVSQMALGFHWLLAANESSTLSPEPLKRFLKALLMAEDFALTNEDEAKEIVCKRFDLNSKSIQRLWPKHRLTITLNQSIIISLKNYVDWTMSKEGKFGENPHIQSFIYTGALEEINPKLVTIFR
jgi:NitT/TauT family transport system substrate-binding protein